MTNSKKKIAILIAASAFLIAWIILEQRTVEKPLDVVSEPIVAPTTTQNVVLNDVATTTPATPPVRSNRASSEEMIEMVKKCEVSKLVLIQHSGRAFGVELVAILMDDFSVNLIDIANWQKVVEVARGVETSCGGVIPFEKKSVISPCEPHEDCI